MSTARRVPFLDALRIFCMYGVILGHLATWRIDALPVGGGAWAACNLYNCLMRFCVPAFLMVSGFLALDCPTYEEADRRRKTRLTRFVPTYLFWSFLYAALSLLQGVRAGTPDIARFFADWVAGEFHLWYLVMLCGIYLVLPLLFLITRNPAGTRLFLGLSFTLTILLPSVAGGVPALAPLATLLQNSYLDFGFLFFFVAGYALRERPVPAKIGRWLWVPALGAVALCTVLTAQLSAAAGSYQLYWLNQRGILTTLAALGFFITAQSCAPFWEKHPLPAGLAGLTLGIYVVHVFVILLLQKLGLTDPQYISPLTLPLGAAVVFALSAAVTFLCKKLPVLKRLV